MVRLSVWSRIHVFLAPLSVQTSLNESWVVDLNVIWDIGHCSVYQGSETTVPHQEGTRCGSKGLRLETRTSSLRSIGPGSCLAMLWRPLHVWTQCGTLCLDSYTPWVDIVRLWPTLNVFPSHLRLLPPHMKQISLLGSNYRLSNEMSSTWSRLCLLHYEYPCLC